MKHLKSIKLIIHCVIFNLILTQNTFSDELKSFSIDGLTIGDDLSFFFDENNIKKLEKNYHKNKTFIPIEKKSSSPEYEVIQIYYKKSETEKKIYAIAGINNSDITKCNIKKDDYIEKFKFLFNSSFFEKKTLEKKFPKGKRVKYENRFTLKNGSYAYVACYDWAKGTYPDQMRVGLTHSEFDTWIYKQIN
jgi:hypothetical protein